jgi:membrane protein DedA with SNARE-associated domain
MLSVFVGRTAHYLVTAILTVYFGPEIMNWMGGHSMLMLTLLAILMTVFVIYVIYRRRRRCREES